MLYINNGLIYDVVAVTENGGIIKLNGSEITDYAKLAECFDDGYSLNFYGVERFFKTFEEAYKFYTKHFLQQKV